MATIVNNPAPAPSNNSGGSMGIIIGLLVLIIIGFIFFVYGLPALQHIQVTPQVNVPNKINVNVHQTK